MASHRPQSVELVDFCVRDESFTLFISGIPKLHVGELQGRIVLLAGQPLHSYVFDWNAGPASMRVTTMTLTGARNVVEALDGALFRGRRLRVQHKLAKHANAGWARPTHRLPLLTARQCCLVATGLLGGGGWSHRIEFIAPLVASQLSEGAAPLALSQQPHSSQGSPPSRRRWGGGGAASPPSPSPAPASPPSQDATEAPSDSDLGDGGDGSLFATQHVQLSHGCVEQRPPPASLVAAAEQRVTPDGKWASTDHVFWNTPAGRAGAAGPAVGDGAAGLPAEIAAILVDDWAGSAGVDGGAGQHAEGSHAAGLSASLLESGVAPPSRPPGLVELDVGWTLQGEGVVCDPGTAHDDSVFHAVFREAHGSQDTHGEGNALYPPTKPLPPLCEPPVVPCLGGSGALASSGTLVDPVAYYAAVTLSFPHSALRVVGRGAYGQLSDAAAVAAVATGAEVGTSGIADAFGRVAGAVQVCSEEQAAQVLSEGGPP